MTTLGTTGDTPQILLPMPGARISQGFGENSEYYAQYGLRGHNGVDLASPEPGRYLTWHGFLVAAVADGLATVAYDHAGYGLYVYVRGDGYDWLYAHLSEVIAHDGQTVQAGHVIGRVGYTGNVIPHGAAGTHLHWGKRPNNPYHLDAGMRGYVDPLEHNEVERNMK